MRIGLGYLYKDYAGRYQDFFHVNKDGKTTAYSILCEKGNTIKLWILRSSDRDRDISLRFR